MKRTIYLVLLLVLWFIISACAAPAPASEPAADAAVDAGSDAAMDDGSFNWQRFAGTEVTVMIAEHPVADGMRELLPEFEEATGHQGYD